MRVTVTNGDIMKEEKTKNVDFSKLTPKMQVKKVHFNKLYKKAFLDKDKLPYSEYGRNTSAED